MPVAPAKAAATPQFEFSSDEAGRVTVMTRNMYIGADVDVVIAALVTPDPTDDLPALLATVDVLSRTDFPARVAALAKEIARARPHVVGLQEVEDVVIDLGSLRPPVNLHFLPMLRTELAARGLNYVVAGDVTNFVVAPLPGVSLTDHDVMLVDADRVTVGPSVVARPYTLNIGPIAPGVALRRGWVQIEATIDGNRMTFASTHLEAVGPAALRAGQARELASFIGTELPAIVLGDFNDDPWSPAHAVVVGAGFVDAWESLRPGEPGFTCCQLADLSNARSLLDRRIDYVFARGFGDAVHSLKGMVTLVGERPSDRVPGAFYPVWPSDHAGVVGRFRLKNAK
jgi:endonuclease/exonuclease/phosphatase family metal-dependent hydrolase